MSSGWTLLSVPMAILRIRDDLVCISSASAAVEMAAMYCENRMTAGWTYDIASLEHGKAPRLSLMFHHLSSAPNKSQALIGQPSSAACRTEFFRAMMRSMTSAAA